MQQATTSRSATDYSHRLPPYWCETIASYGCQWIGRRLFENRSQRGATVKTACDQLWNHPPLPAGTPSIVNHFGKSLFMWAPKIMWKVLLCCPSCKQELTFKDLYPRARKVVSTSSFYYLAGELYECLNRTCKNSSFISYTQELRD